MHSILRRNRGRKLPGDDKTVSRFQCRRKPGKRYKATQTIYDDVLDRDRGRDGEANEVVKAGLSLTVA